MTDIATLPTDVAAPVDRPPLASWSRRVVAAFLDDAILGGATWLVLGLDGQAPSLTPSFPVGEGAGDSLSWVTSAWLVGVLVALLALQGYTGATPGKRVAGVAVVGEADGLPIGFVRSAARVLAHLLDAILLVGYLRPLWNAKRQTFADTLVGTLAIQTREPAAHPWFARFRREPSAGRSTVVSVGAVVLVVVGVGFSTTNVSGGSSDQAPVPCVDDGTVAGPTASADAAHTRSTSYERRLWVTRSTTDTQETGLGITWTVALPSSDLSLDSVHVETDLVSADGSVVTLTQDDVQATAWQDDRVVLGAVPVPQGDLDESGPGWTARSRLTVDGAVVGACTVDAADWAGATLPVVPGA